MIGARNNELLTQLLHFRKGGAPTRMKGSCQLLAKLTVLRPERKFIESLWVPLEIVDMVVDEHDDR